MPTKPIILIAEDDAVLCLLAQKQCSSIGLECHVARNGREAVDMAQQKYDLIFMDLSMPELSGIEATSRIRERELREGRKRIPIVGLTAFSEREICMGAGMDEFIQKPMLMEQLRTVVRKFLAL